MVNQKSAILERFVFGQRHSKTYWEITTDTETMPENSTSFVMTNIQEKRNQMKKTIGNLYGLRTWVEYGLRQCKQELGWTDYRLTKYAQIEKWWELIMSAYLLISFNTQPFLSLNSSNSQNCRIYQANVDCAAHEQWNQSGGWKNVLNNFRLLIQPILLLWSIFPWVDVFPNSSLLLGFNKLINSINQFQSFYPSG